MLYMYMYVYCIYNVCNSRSIVYVLPWHHYWVGEYDRITLRERKVGIITFTQGNKGK